MIESSMNMLCFFHFVNEFLFISGIVLTVMGSLAPNRGLEADLIALYEGCIVLD